jgi:hypothetical protein
MFVVPPWFSQRTDSFRVVHRLRSAAITGEPVSAY